MPIIIPDMQMPEKCCKCLILEKHHSVCQLLGRRVVDPGKRHGECPLVECTTTDRCP